MTDLGLPTRAATLPVAEAATYAGWFACLADPTRVRILHQVATAPGTTVGALAEALGIGQPTVSHHVRKLADAGFVEAHKYGTSTVVSINPACCTGLPHAADAVMGVIGERPCCPDDLPGDVRVRALATRDWDVVRKSFRQDRRTIPPVERLDTQWLPGHRWIAEVNGHIAGWAALAAAGDGRDDRRVVDNLLWVDPGMRGRGVGKSLLRTQVVAADDDEIWTLQATLRPTDRPAIGLHHSAGFRTVGVRERFLRHDGQWHDAVLLERRSEVAGR